MKISIITPCFNSEKYIKETIESVLSQKGDFELEYIIIDGGSTDGTVEIIRSFISESEKNTPFVPLKQGDNAKGETPSQTLAPSSVALLWRDKKGEGLEHPFPLGEGQGERSPHSSHYSPLTLHLLSEPDSGMYDALAKGFQIATGDVIGYINSDDFYFPGALSVVDDVFNDVDVKWMTGLKARVNEKGQTFYVNMVSSYKRKMILQGFHGPFLKYIQQECTFFRKELLGFVDVEKLKSFRYAGDYYLWKNFAENEELTVVEALVGGFRFREGQLSSNKKEYYKEFNEIRDKRTISGYATSLMIKLYEFILSPDIKRLLFKKNKKYSLKDGWK